MMSVSFICDKWFFFIFKKLNENVMSIIYIILSVIIILKIIQPIEFIFYTISIDPL